MKLGLQEKIEQKVENTSNQQELNAEAHKFNKDTY
jgi:hypothetical protein